MSKILGVRLQEKEYNKLKTLSEKKGVSISELVRTFINFGMGNKSKLIFEVKRETEKYSIKLKKLEKEIGKI